jgi:O-antigen/teichoic acid export membrane protein
MLGKWKFYSYKDIGKHLSEIDINVTKDEMRELFITVWHNAWREGVVTVCNFLSNQASTLICSWYFSLSETGIYSLGVQIASAVSTVAAALYSAYQPQLQEAYANQNKEKVRSTMSVIVVSYVIIFFVGLMASVFIGLPVLRLIKPETVVSVPILLGLSSYQFILKFRNCYTSYFSCTNRICYIKSFVCAAVVGVVLSVLFTGTFVWGMWGMIAAQILSQVMYNVWFWAIKAHVEMELSFFDMFAYAKKEIMRLVHR